MKISKRGVREQKLNWRRERIRRLNTKDEEVEKKWDEIGGRERHEKHKRT